MLSNNLEVHRDMSIIEQPRDLSCKLSTMFQKEFNPNLTDFFKSKASFLLKNLEMKILWMVLQMIETQTLTTFLFVDTDENGELSVFIKSEY